MMWAQQGREEVIDWGREVEREMGRAHSQIDHAEGGVVGNDNDNDNNGHGHNNDDKDDNNDDNCGCGGWDGHHQMRKVRGHDDRINTTIK